MWPRSHHQNNLLPSWQACGLKSPHCSLCSWLHSNFREPAFPISRAANILWVFRWRYKDLSRVTQISWWVILLFEVPWLHWRGPCQACVSVWLFLISSFSSQPLIPNYHLTQHLHFSNYFHRVYPVTQYQEWFKKKVGEHYGTVSLKSIPKQLP